MSRKSWGDSCQGNKKQLNKAAFWLIESVDAARTPSSSYSTAMWQSTKDIPAVSFVWEQRKCHQDFKSLILLCNTLVPLWKTSKRRISCLSFLSSEYPTCMLYIWICRTYMHFLRAFQNKTSTSVNCLPHVPLWLAQLLRRYKRIMTRQWLIMRYTNKQMNRSCKPSVSKPEQSWGRSAA